MAPTAFVGALTYLILLDQVGKAICPAPGRPPADVPFLAALTDFAPPLSERDREMLYSLRNALAHELAMVNEGRGNPLRRHRFELHEAEDRKLVVYPTTPWNGLFGDASGGGNTAVNLTELATLVEGVVALIEQMCQQRQLALVNGVTPEMVLDRWGFRIYHGPSC